MFEVTLHTTYAPGPTVVFDCPACGCHDVPAVAYERRETPRLLFVIPLFTHASTWVVCGACHARLASRVPASELQGKSPEQLRHLLCTYTSLPGRLLAIVSLLFAIVPIFGLVFGVIAVLVNWRSRGWPRFVSRASLLVSALLHGLLALALITDGRSGHRL